MKDFILLTAVCLVVVVGVGWLLLPGTPADLFRSRVTVAVETPEPTSAEPPITSPPPPGAPHPKVPPHRVEALTVIASPIAPAAQGTSKPFSVTPVSFNLPFPWDVPPGESGSDLVDTYGAPALLTSTQESGHVFETYVYRSSGTQAIVHLEDGKVSQVQLKDSPALARP